MPFVAWLLIVLTVLGMAAKIVSVGKPRKPCTPEEAAAAVVINALYLWAIIYLAQN